MVEIVEFKPRDKVLNQQVIDTLEEYLRMAKSGEVVALALASVTDDGGMMTCTCASDCFPALLGAMALLQHRAIKATVIIREDTDA